MGCGPGTLPGGSDSGLTVARAARVHLGSCRSPSRRKTMARAPSGTARVLG